MLVGLRDALNTLTIGVGLGLLVYGIAWALRAKLPSDWTYLDIALSPKKWVVLLAVLVALGQLGAISYDYIELRHKRSLVPPRDKSRFSIAVPDFNGEGGISAADIIANQLQIMFGESIQVVRVPEKFPENSYGDILANSLKGVSASFKCAERYNADIVVWGTFNRDASTVQLSSTVSGDRCMLSSCGAMMEGDFPGSFPIGDIGRDDSPLRHQIGSIAILKATLPVNMIAQRPSANACFQNAALVDDYLTRTSLLLKHASGSLRPKDEAQLLMADAIYQSLHGGISRIPNDFDRAIETFKEAKAVDPSLTTAISQPYAIALYQKELLRNDPDYRRTIASEIGSLPTDKETDVAAGLLKVKADAWHAVYETTRSFEDYRSADGAYGKALALEKAPDVRFELNIDRASLNLDRLYFGNNPEAFRVAAVSVNEAHSFFSHLPRQVQARAPLEQMYGLYALRLRMSTLTSDLRYAIWAGEDLQDNKRVFKENWADGGYAEMRHALAMSYYHIFEATNGGEALESTINELTKIANGATDKETKAAAYVEAAHLREVAMQYTRDGVYRSEAEDFYKKAATIYTGLGERKHSSAALANAQRLASSTKIGDKVLQVHCAKIPHPEPGVPAMLCVRFEHKH